MSSPANGVRAPRQARSRQSLDRILAAAEAVLESKPLGQVRLAEIADRAGLTTGAIYARFDGKAALFQALEQRVRSDLEAHVDGALNEIESDVSLETAVFRILCSVADFYRERRGGVRAIVRTASSDAETQERRAADNQTLLHRVLERLEETPDSITHPAPQTAFRLAMLATIATLRELYLYRELLPDEDPEPIEPTCRELSRLFVSYLTAPSS